MFYTGDLQSGINVAIQQSKLVACFVGDDGRESNIWETEFLADRQVAHLFAEKTVLLRLQAGSEEASFLAAIYPLPKTPTLVIMQNGQLKEYLNAGVSKPDFLQRVKIVLDNSNNSSPSGGALTPVSATEVPEAVPAEATQSQAVQNVLQERRARLEAAKKQQDAFEKAERAAKAAQRKEALENAAVSDPKKAADIKYAQLQKKRQQEARAERERILKRVEDDKAERRAKEALRKEQARVAAGEQSPHEASLTSQSTSIHSASTTRATECAIQVRLFDGTTIRSRFPCHKTLSKDVREWVDSKSANSGVPYNFKQISTPLPNRTIEMSEEEQTLQSLGLVPSATLVLIPIKDYTSAYQGGATGIVSRGLSAGFGLVTSGLGLVTGTLSSVLGSTAPTEAASGPERSPSPSETRSREHQLYNGNALNFEPRRDTIDKED